MYDSIARGIKRSGSIVTIRVATKGAIDFDTGLASKTYETRTQKALLLGYSTRDIIDGVVNMGDLRCIIQSDLEVQVGDEVIIDSKRYSVISVNKTIKSDVLLKSTLQLRA